MSFTRQCEILICLPRPAFRLTIQSSCSGCVTRVWEKKFLSVIRKGLQLISLSLKKGATPKGATLCHWMEINKFVNKQAGKLHTFHLEKKADTYSNLQELNCRNGFEIIRDLPIPGWPSSCWLPCAERAFKIESCVCWAWDLRRQCILASASASTTLSTDSWLAL